MKIVKLTKESRENLLENLLQRSPSSFEAYEKNVREIVEDVKRRGDEAVFAYTERFDKVKTDAATLQVTEEEIREAYACVEPGLIDVIRKALVNIRSFHEKQKRNSWFDTTPDGTILGQRITALQRVGVYVPGGKAVYPSSVLMNIVPAKVAGVDEIVMTTPPGKDGKVNPATLVAAMEAGADRVFKVGGAQAIAALAYGTKSIPKADKIVGPGNIYVALAKKAVYGHVSIDSIAGPSEILVLADDGCDARCVAADMLSQAEHDRLATAVLVTTSARLADEVSDELERQIPLLPRADIARESIDVNGKIILCDDLDEAILASNTIAPEHLELCVEEPFALLDRITNAGSIFMGRNVPEALGDYLAGPNHTLPTSGTARFSSPLSVDDFVKKSSFLYYSKEALKEVCGNVAMFARMEGLEAHARSIESRFEEGKA